MHAIKALMIGLAGSSLWPTYLLILSYVVRLSPCPRSLSRPLSFVLSVTAVAVFLSGFLRRQFGAEGFASQTFQVPRKVIGQLRRARTFVLATAGLFLLPSQLLSQGLLAPSGQPLYAHTIDRLLILAFELSFLWTCYRVVRHRGALAVWLTSEENPVPWLGRHRRTISWTLLLGTALLIALDTQGYGFTARRLALALGQTLVLVVACWLGERALRTLIDRHAWRWVKTGSVEAEAPAADIQPEPDAADPVGGDLGVRLRRIVHYGVPISGLFIAAWIWEFDLALFRYVTEQKLWTTGAGETLTTLVSVGDVVKALIIFGVTGVLWRNLATIFAVAVYPRMTDDPGVRFAFLTLGRYLVLGLGILGGLTAVNLGLDKIGVVLAALGVGLGFGLQEIVSNFVSGIILLLERPLRVGDVVTVANMTGKVDRINIRATTIINGDNQSMIIPNREFITGNLVNWTHKDKIIRVTINLAVAFGTDPDRVCDLLLAIAREDPDVLDNPVANAILEEFSPFALKFALRVYVPEPSVAGRVKHRLGTQIQKRFQSSGIEIPLPKQELKFHAAELESVLMSFVPAQTDAAASIATANTTQSAISHAPHIRIDRPPQSLIEA